MPSFHGGQESEGVISNVWTEDKKTAVVTELFVAPDSCPGFTTRQSASDFRDNFEGSIEKSLIEGVFAGQELRRPDNRQGVLQSRYQ